MSERENIERKLYEACLSGSVAELDTLIEKDQLILDRVNSFTYFFNDTPLHVAVLRGHLDLTKALLTRNSKLAFELDLSRCSPLHIASTKGHVEIVRELLRVNTNACLARDQDGRIPLHLAAMKGRVEVIKELLQAKPESIREKLDKGETVLHLCVKYNRLEALKTLIEDLDGNEFLLSSGDDNGNTILHLAAALKQMDTIKHLLGIKNVKEHCTGIKNCNGSTVLDVVEHCPNRDLKTMEIRELLPQTGVRKSICDGSNPESPPNDCTPKSIVQSMARLWITYFNVDPLWLKEARGHLITAATLTATMAYQAILSPPRGVWPDVKDGQGAKQAILNGQDSLKGHKAGQAVLKSTNSAAFLGINSVVLFASLCTIMLALSGFSNQNKFLLRLVVTLHITLAGMACAYGFAILAVFPFNAGYNGTMSGLLLALGGVIGFLLLVHVCHFLVWLTKKSACLDRLCFSGRRSCFNCIPNYC